MNGRKSRILIGAFMPAFLGVLFFFSTSAAFDAEKEFKIRELFDPMFLLIMLVAYAFVGIQSLIYSFLMEFIVNPKIVNNFVVVFTSMIMGAVSGVVLGSVGAAIGLMIGFLLGLILRYLYIKSVNSYT